MRVDGGGVRRWGRKVRLFDRFLEVEEGWCSSSVMIWGFCSGSKSSESESDSAASPRE